MHRLGLFGGLVALVAGCSVSSSSPREATLTDVSLPAHPTLAPLPDPQLNDGHTGRAPRRLSVAQLEQSIITTTGKKWSKLEARAASLGRADFAVTVSEATEANLVFAKFLEDGAREVCLAVAKEDLARTDAGARVLSAEVPGTTTDFTTLTDELVAKNLASLALRFWGSTLEDAERARWVSTFRQLAVRAKATAKPEQAWGAICVAMMTDPRFFTY
jgi:hypothetical protein